MKTISTRIAVTALIFAVAACPTGCTKTTEEGGPGAVQNESNTSNRDTENEDQTFTLSLPRLKTSIEQGGEETVKIDVNLGDEFRQEVTISVEPPEGLSVAPKTARVTAETDEVSVVVKADPDAALGRKEINVVGKPAEGKSVTGTIEVEIVANE
jgi:uncharacterized membrane protein